MGFFNFRKKGKKGSQHTANPQTVFDDAERSKNMNTNSKAEIFVPDLNLLLKDYTYTHSIFSENIFGEHNLLSDEKLYSTASISSSSASDTSSATGKDILTDTFNLDARLDSTKASKDEYSCSSGNDNTVNSTINSTMEGTMGSCNNVNNKQASNLTEKNQPSSSPSPTASTTTIHSSSPPNSLSVRNEHNSAQGEKVIEPVSKKEVDRPDLPFIADKDGKEWYAHTMERMRKRHRKEYRMSSQRMVNIMGDTAILPTPRTTSLIHYAGNSASSRKSIQLSPLQTYRSVPDEKYARQSVLQVFDPHQCIDSDLYRYQHRNTAAFANGYPRQSFLAGHNSVRAASPQSHVESYRGSFLDTEPIHFSNSAMQLRQQQRRSTYRYSHRTALPNTLQNDMPSRIETHSSKILVPYVDQPNSLQACHHPFKPLDNRHSRESERISDIIALFPETNDKFDRTNQYNKQDRYSQQYITPIKNSRLSHTDHSATMHNNANVSSANPACYNREDPSQYSTKDYNHCPMDYPEKTSVYTYVDKTEIPSYQLNSQCSHHRPHFTMVNRRISSSDRPKSLNSSRTENCRHQSQLINNNSRCSCHNLIHSNDSNICRHSQQGSSASSMHCYTGSSSTRSTHSHSKRRHSRCPHICSFVSH